MIVACWTRDPIVTKKNFGPQSFEIKEKQQKFYLYMILKSQFEDNVRKNQVLVLVWGTYFLTQSIYQLYPYSWNETG